MPRTFRTRSLQDECKYFILGNKGVKYSKTLLYSDSQLIETPFGNEKVALSSTITMYNVKVHFIISVVKHFLNFIADNMN